MQRTLAAFLLSPIFLSAPLLPAQLPFSSSEEPSLDRRLAMYAKPSVVRVINGCIGKFRYHPHDASAKPHNTDRYFTVDNKRGGVGSGFFINPSGYIATNAHVVELQHDQSQQDQNWCNRESLEQEAVQRIKRDFQAFVLSSGKLNDEKIKANLSFEKGPHELRHVTLPNGEAFPFEVKAFGDPISEEMRYGGKDIAIIKIEVENAPSLELGDASLVKIQDYILTLSYPGLADITLDEEGYNKPFLEIEDLLKFFPADEASVTKGEVANPNKRLPNQSSVLQMDVSVSGGSSGGAVLNDLGEVIGMITFHKEFGSSSVPFAVTINTIKEFIAEAGVTNEQGVVDELYRKGLELYWQKDYQGAKTKFEAVKALFPQHSEADRLIRECNQAIAEEWSRDYLPWLAIGGLAAVVLVLSYLLLKQKSAPVEPKSAPVEPGGEALGIPNATPDPPDPKKWPSVSKAITGIFQPPTAISTDPFVELKNAQGQGRQVYLRQTRHQLGRDRNWADINVPDEGWEVISRHHAILEKEGDDYRIYDGDLITTTTNGIFVNGNRISPKEGYLLKDGDQLKIGLDPHNQVTLTYYHPVHSQSSAPIHAHNNAQ